MKILNEFVPTRKFLKHAEEIKDLVDGWNVTDSAAGFPAPSGTVVSCVLKSKYPDKWVVPIFILHYKGPVEVGGLALAADAIGLDGLALTMGDVPKYGEPIKVWRTHKDVKILRGSSRFLTHISKAQESEVRLFTYGTTIFGRHPCPGEGCLGLYLLYEA